MADPVADRDTLIAELLHEARFAERDGYHVTAERMRRAAAALSEQEKELAVARGRARTLEAALWDVNGRVQTLEAVAAAAWGYRVFYEAYWGEGVPDSAMPVEWKQRQTEALVGWQAELDAAIAALDDNPGDFRAAVAAHRATIARALAAAVSTGSPDEQEGGGRAAPGGGAS